MAARRRPQATHDDYHRYRELQLDLGGRPTRVITKPGIAHWSRPDPATELLMEVVEAAPAAQVLDLECGAGWVGLVMAQRIPQGFVCLTDRHAVAVEAARRTLALNGVLNASVHLSDCGAAVRGRTFDLVIIHAPRERAVARQCLRDAAELLRPGGRCYLAGANRSGVKSVIRDLGEMLGEAHVLAHRGGSRVALAIKGQSPGREGAGGGEPYDYRELAVRARGTDTVCITKPGLFSWNRMDEGTRQLVEHMEIGPQERVLDLGCGTGLAGLVAADLAAQGEVTLVDVDCVAVEAARKTLAHHGATNAQVLLSDCASAVLDSVFDVVITNPPFHQGHGVSYQVARQFIRDAAAVLQPGGRLYLVANRFIAYGREMEGLFEEVSFVHRDNRFQVWRAVKGGGP